MVKRYEMGRDHMADCFCSIDEGDNGSYVDYDDYDALAERLAEADKANQLLRVDLAAAAQEEDLILHALRLDPERYRTECGYLNVPKIIAAIKHPDEYPRLTDSAPAGLRTGPVKSLTVVSGSAKGAK